MSEENKSLEKHDPPDESLLVRPVTASRLSTLTDDYGYNNFAPHSQFEGLHMRELWRMMRKRKWLILAITAILTSLVTIEIHRTPSTYRATAQIEVAKDVSTTVVSTKDFVVQSDDSDNINTKLVIIKSRPLLEDVVVNLKLDQDQQFFDATRKRTACRFRLRKVSERRTGRSGHTNAGANAIDPESRPGACFPGGPCGGWRRLRRRVWATRAVAIRLPAVGGSDDGRHHLVP